jgi:hypothetical protein
MLDAYRRRGARATMLEQESNVRRERAEDGKKNSELKHRLDSEKSLGLDAVFSFPPLFELSA